MLAPVSFIVAGLIAWLTAMSYSKLAVLFPQSAGEAIYIEQGFQRQWLSITVGLLIILTGIVSAATLTRGFIGYFVLLVPINETFAMVAVLVLLTGLAIWGIAESLTMAALITLIEIAGLLIVLLFCGDSLQQLPEQASKLFIPTSKAELVGIFSGAFLAFYAFIGFEDMVNVVEEVKQPEVTMPKAIFWVVVISTSLYVVIALVATLSLPAAELAQSKAPLAELLSSKSAAAAKVVAVISVLAIVNGVLIQIIMASRVCYGLSKRYKGPAYLYRVSAITKTPVIATLLIALLILVASLAFPLTALAKFTSFIILIIFCLINLALWLMHRNHYRSLNPEVVKQVEKLRSYPLLAAGLCFGLLAFQIGTFL